MAQSMLPWPLQSASTDDVKPSGTALVGSSPGMAYSSDRSWSGAAGVSTSFDCQQVEPYILRQSDSQFGQNSDLMYNHLGTQNGTPKGCGYTVPATRAVAHLSGLPQGANPILSTAVMRTSISPKSFTSDEFDNSYSPEPMPDQASPSCNWGTIPMYSSNTVMPLLKPEAYYADAGISDMPQMEGSLGLSLAPSTGHTGRGQTIQIPRKGLVSAPEHSYSHDSNQGASPWFNPKYLSSTDHMWGTQSQSPLGTESHAAPTQDHVQPRLQVPRRSSTQGQRERNDRVLIEGKKRGETYKEIKKKLIGEDPAESTLRGRYRSLTKDRRDRVRKPVWTKFDTELLNETVLQELKRIESNLQNPSALSIEQKLMKVSWKKVADYIEENGGSYHFGNSTCKRKWLELNPACE
ncbi:hypothetical protein COCMIDRAFT_36222 [Bipolaris oryzae ATCC 44560]|uniref:Myb-like domain-containing protein n=1 Tax=Bipolaris oryzae ATCC 44560 TaxID=930090 RepID=W6Z801_COCMI|nr:uncharacterized protein COCMIDRAFT_36222 [Bipolaris oryzae ATCC 44560]EUC46135.1 hypothetical protein COCMIDRAFT_36222 [Bipolaris oryzae ATCC 44560]